MLVMVAHMAFYTLVCKQTNMQSSGCQRIHLFPRSLVRTFKSDPPDLLPKHLHLEFCCPSSEDISMIFCLKTQS